VLDNVKQKLNTVFFFTEITCRPLPFVKDGKIYSSACTKDDVPFGTTCSIPSQCVISPSAEGTHIPSGVHCFIGGPTTEYP
jgi:hypothetical protein